MVEAKTKGRGGYRYGAGRPKDKEQKSRIYLPEDIVNWLKKSPENQNKVRQLISKNST